jgi:ribosomal protein S18 acetylase RimI-like enzyme
VYHLNHIKLRDAETKDCTRIAALHSAIISTGFLSQLGDKFLSDLYRAMACFPGAILIVAEDEQGQVSGFISGCINTGSFYRYFFRKHMVGACVSLLPKLISLKNLRRLFETAVYPFKTKKIFQAIPRAELLSMAVAEHYQGKGIGIELFKCLVKELKVKGCNSFRVIVGVDNHQANRLYQKMCSRLSHQIEIHSGQLSNVYIYES